MDDDWVITLALLFVVTYHGCVLRPVVCINYSARVGGIFFIAYGCAGTTAMHSKRSRCQGIFDAMSRTDLSHGCQIFFQQVFFSGCSRRVLDANRAAARAERGATDVVLSPQ